MVSLAEMVITVRDVLVLIGLALFLAIGLEPAVSVLARHKFPRWSAVIIVLVASLGVVGGFLAAAIPPLGEREKPWETGSVRDRGLRGALGRWGQDDAMSDAAPFPNPAVCQLRIVLTGAS